MTRTPSREDPTMIPTAHSSPPSPRPRGRLLLLGVSAILALSGCGIVQDAFQVGEREFTFETAAEAEASDEAFRFQGFLPEDATDVRLIAQLDGHAAVMRWTSPTVFESEHCTPAPVTTEPEIDADWLPEQLPEHGSACRDWTVVRSDGLQVAWINSPAQ